jgi:membrane-associated protease RseP (regulator of RpoE activity)
MKRGSTIFLQVVTALLGVGVLALLLWEPQVEGRNVNATQFEIYFKDPFLAYIYVAFVPFFVGLYQAFKILGYARRREIFVARSVRALRIIKYCALTTAIFILGAVAYLFIFMRAKDDIAGGVAMGVFIILVSAIIATAAAVFERILQNRAEVKSRTTSLSRSSG